MIVYSATKAQFNNDVNLNLISDKILEKERYLRSFLENRLTALCSVKGVASYGNVKCCH